MSGTNSSPGGGGIVVIGGGMAGITTALEAAEAGHEVFLVEKEPYLGGRVARMWEYFPKLCPPSCGLEINFRRIKQNIKIKVFTQAEVTAVEGVPGNYLVRVHLSPRKVNNNCTCCNKCVEACPVERADDFNYGMGTTKAIYLPHPMAYPARFVVDPAVCPGERCQRCLPFCAYDAIELGEQARDMTLSAASVVVATGWKPYDAGRMENLGFGRLPDVITNVMMERLAAAGGPTKGRIQRPSDGGPVRRVAFVQCAGSRDEHHLPYCSTVCCTATLKQVTYLRRQDPEIDIHVFYIDIRAMGILEDFFARVKNDPNVHLHKGKVARIDALGSDGLRVVAEDIASGQRLERLVDLAVLATGMEPSVRLAGQVPYDALGFVQEVSGQGIHGAGCAKRPCEVVSSVQDATGAALRSIQDLPRR